ncbi:OsmC family protein [Pseudonocardia sp. MH-G8]|uniref:OsmC family protein n=1 Tax=Pseudonocardia sp. MH-G8 TaxID=1854588 RepID=UPI000B9FAC23|nr:OsmC family protein [Pseudonocardia sp. MH-G8]OZM83835.1 osmotically inducible protein OsmC [Pseudonocardia sp. MH-G8]
MTDPVHLFRAHCSWTGSTGAGHEEYARTIRAGAPPAEAELTLSSDPAFLGDAALLNPEQLLVLAVASCQLLAFLAVAARARVDVRDYREDATATMSQAHRPIRLDEIVLRPRITLVAGPTEERVRHLVEVAHRECFVAHSVATPIRIEPLIAFVEPA